MVFMLAQPSNSDNAPNNKIAGLNHLFLNTVLITAFRFNLGRGVRGREQHSTKTSGLNGHCGDGFGFSFRSL